MKKILILIFALCAVAAQAQTPLNLAVKFQINSPGSTGTNPNFTLNGFVVDDLGRWDATNVAVGDSLYALNGSDLVVAVVTTINSAVGNTLNVVVTSTDPTVLNIDPGQAAIIHPTPGYRLSTYISGLRDDLRSLIMNRLSTTIDESIRQAQEIAFTTGNTPPANSVATVLGYRLAKNNGGDGVLYEWDGTQWVENQRSGGGSSYDFESSSTITMTLIGPTVESYVNNNSLDSTHIKDGGIRPREINQAGATTGQVLKFNGTIWSPANDLTGSGTSSGIDTLSNYNALRSYTGTSSVVFVQDFSYIFNGIQYTTLGGFFRQVVIGNENGATIIVGTGGRIWSRVWDNVNVQPEWWEVGGYDTDGTTNPSRFTLNGIFNNRDRLQAAVNIGYGKTVLLGAAIRTYDIDIAVVVDGELNIHGNGVTLRRPNSPTPLLTSNFTGTSCTVTSAAGFRVGMSLLALDINNSKGRSPFYGGYGNEENSRTEADPTKPVITAISGNTISYSPAPPATIPVGGVLQINDDLMGLISVLNHTFEIKDVVFDGNWSNGGGTYRYSNDFTASHSLFQTVQSKTLVRMTGLTFKRVPAENVIVCSTIVSGCKADSLFGSFVHISRFVERDEAIVEVSGCEVSNTGLATVPVNIHGEAAITWSANPNGYKIHHNTFINGKHFVIGYLTKDDENRRDNDNFYFSENVCKNYYAITIGKRPFVATTFPFAGVNFINNVFENCGDLTLLKENGLLQRGAMWENVNITGNYFINSRLICEGVANANINNNKIIFTPEYPNKPFFGRHPAAIQDGVVNNGYQAAMVVNGTNINILNNFIEGFQTYNDTLRVGLHCDVLGYGAVKTSGGANTDFAYSQNINISGNNIAGFSRSIVMSQGNFGYVINNLECVNVIVRNNNLYNNGTNTVGYNWGINVPRGAICEGNHITAVTGFAIIAMGAYLDNPTPGKHLSIRGSIITRNIIRRGNINIGDGDGNYNVIVEGNYMPSAVPIGADPTRNYVAGNVLTNTTNLPTLTLPQTPVYQYFLQNKSQY